MLLFKFNTIAFKVDPVIKGVMENGNAVPGTLTIYTWDSTTICSIIICCSTSIIIILIVLSLLIVVVFIVVLLLLLVV